MVSSSVCTSGISPMLISSGPVPPSVSAALGSAGLVVSVAAGGVAGAVASAGFAGSAGAACAAGFAGSVVVDCWAITGAAITNRAIVTQETNVSRNWAMAKPSDFQF